MSNCKRHGLVHPARFPVSVPEFFIRFLTTRKSQIVLDPFAGSNSTGYAAEKLGRKWIGIEKSDEYLKGSMFRFFRPRIVRRMWTEIEAVRKAREFQTLPDPLRDALQ
jgi:DNA modification methylase